MKNPTKSPSEKTANDFLLGKSEHTVALFKHFVQEFRVVGKVNLRATKSMVSIQNGDRGIAYVTTFGKNFIHVVFPFKKPYPDNLCFQKIAQVPGDAQQYNHHFRMQQTEDVNKEVLKFMSLAYHG